MDSYCVHPDRDIVGTLHSHHNMMPSISDDLEQTVDANHGCAFVQGKKTSYVVMAFDVYRNTMGLKTEEDLQASLRSVDEAIEDMEAGRTTPLRDVIAELDDDDA